MSPCSEKPTDHCGIYGMSRVKEYYDLYGKSKGSFKMITPIV